MSSRECAGAGTEVENIDALFFVYYGLLWLAFVPQMAKTVQTKSVHDLSTPMYVLALTGSTLWLIYYEIVFPDHTILVWFQYITVAFRALALTILLRYKISCCPLRWNE